MPRNTHNAPLLSVIMITYNHAKYIREAIESILTQTYQNFELVIVDDGSTDRTSQIISRFADQRIIKLKQRNNGPSSALNEGIKKSHGEYIALMSGDDLSLPTRLEFQLSQIKQSQADIIFCLPRIIGPSSEILPWDTCPFFYGKYFLDTADLYRRFFYEGNFLCAPSAFLRREAIESVGEFKRAFIQLQDFDYWIRACKKYLTIKLFDDPLIKYRYLYGANLSAFSNLNRARIEQVSIYDSFFENAPLKLLRKAFAEHISPESNSPLDIEIDKSLLLLEHSDPLIKLNGISRITRLYDNESAYTKLVGEKSMPLSEFFKITGAIKINDAPARQKGWLHQLIRRAAKGILRTLLRLGGP